jgi:hypothetical protein
MSKKLENLIDRAVRNAATKNDIHRELSKTFYKHFGVELSDVVDGTERGDEICEAIDYGNMGMDLDTLTEIVEEYKQEQAEGRCDDAKNR